MKHITDSKCPEGHMVIKYFTRQEEEFAAQFDPSPIPHANLCFYFVCFILHQILCYVFQNACSTNDLMITLNSWYKREVHAHIVLVQRKQVIVSYECEVLSENITKRN